MVYREKYHHVRKTKVKRYHRRKMTGKDRIVFIEKHLPFFAWIITLSPNQPKWLKRFIATYWLVVIMQKLPS